MNVPHLCLFLCCVNILLHVIGIITFCCVTYKGCLNCRGLEKRFFLLLHLDLNGNHYSECFKAKLIGILCLFLLWGAIIESILHEMNIVYLLKLGVKAAYESGLTFLHGKNSSVK